MTIGEKIKKLRKYAGLTQRKLGELSDTSETTIKQYELGKRQPRIEQLKKIAKVFNFPLYLLMDDNYELENVELEMKRARFANSYEITEPPKPFTRPLNSKYNSPESSSYDTSYSYASSEEELIQILEQRQKIEEETLLSDYRKLNKQGQLEARKRIKELQEIKKYSDVD